MSEPQDGWRSEAARIGEELVALAERLWKLRGSSRKDSAGASDDLLSQVIAEVEARSRRRRIFGTQILSDPAWDILLDLTHAKLTGSPISVSSACIASFSPPTTALRYIGKLEEMGYVQRRGDPADKRRIFVTLTDEGLALMAASLSERPCALGASRPVLAWLANSAPEASQFLHE